MKILIVKTSSLGDIIQSFPVLNYLHAIEPKVEIDWVVEEQFANIVEAHPLISRVIKLPTKPFSILRASQEIKKTHYQYVIDLQGNCKSGFITFLSRGGSKIGFSYSCAREWPNIFATHIRFSVQKDINIRLQYLSVFEQFFKKKSSFPIDLYCARSKTANLSSVKAPKIDDRKCLSIRNTKALAIVDLLAAFTRSNSQFLTARSIHKQLLLDSRKIPK